MTTSRRPRSARSARPARRFLATTGSALLLGLSVTGCSDGDDTATDPAPSESSASGSSASESGATKPPSTATTPPAQAPVRVPATGSAGLDEAWLVSATQAGGRVETLAAPLGSDQEVADFSAQFDGVAMGDQVEQAVQAAGKPGAMTWGTVAAIGCDAPASVTIDAGEAGYEVTAQEPAEVRECFAPVTYVVVFTPAG